MKKKINNLSAAVLFVILCGLFPLNAFAQVTELFSMYYDRFSPTSSEHAHPFYVKMDGSGNVYVIGDDVDNNVLVIKYNSAGAKLWQKQVPSWGEPESAELDNDGNLYIIYDNFPYSENHWISLIKITPSGSAAWSTSYPNAYLQGGYYEKIFMAVGSTGIYVLARTVAPTNRDYITLKFSHSGVLLWQKFYDSSTPTLITWDLPCGIVLDNNENVYVTGKGVDTGTTPSVLLNNTIIKYNSSGTLLWSYKNTRYRGEIHSIAADNSGNVYTAGSSRADTGNFFTTIKYTSSGAQEWVRTLKGTWIPGWENEARKVLIDPNGNPTVLGQLAGNRLNDSSTIITTAKYTPSGTLLWKRDFDDYTSHPVDFTFINSTDILILGKAKNNTDNTDAVLLKYDNNGILKWSQFYDSPYGAVHAEDLDARYDAVSGKTFFYITSVVTPPPDLDADMLTAKFEEVDQPRIVANNTPVKYELQQNYPNPFNPETKIAFSIQKSGNVKLTVYNALGKEVSVLTNSHMEAGAYEIGFDASRYASGVYFYKLQSGDFTDIKKMILIK
jgi:hypothetical protein